VFLLQNTPEASPPESAPAAPHPRPSNRGRRRPGVGDPSAPPARPEISPQRPPRSRRPAKALDQNAGGEKPPHLTRIRISGKAAEVTGVALTA